jgi:hypothetical protein
MPQRAHLPCGWGRVAEGRLGRNGRRLLLTVWKGEFARGWAGERVRERPQCVRGLCVSIWVRVCLSVCASMHCACVCVCICCMVSTLLAPRHAIIAVTRESEGTVGVQSSFCSTDRSIRPMASVVFNPLCALCSRGCTERTHTQSCSLFLSPALTHGVPSRDRIALASAGPVHGVVEHSQAMCSLSA